MNFEPIDLDGYGDTNQTFLSIPEQELSDFSPQQWQGKNEMGPSSIRDRVSVRSSRPIIKGDDPTSKKLFDMASKTTKLGVALLSILAVSSTGAVIFWGIRVFLGQS